MNFLHSREYLNQGDEFIADSTHQCNFLVMDDSNFANFKAGRDYRYFGGFFTHFPASIVIPSTGGWNAVIHTGGSPTTIKASFSVIKHP